MAKADTMIQFKEKRAHRRLDVQLPLEFEHVSESRHSQWRTSSTNVSTSGVYFETSLDNIKVGDRLTLAFGVKPNDPRFPPNGTINTVANVVRVEKIQEIKEAADIQRYGVGAQFIQPLKLSL